MKCANLHAIKDLRFEETDRPVCASDEVLVRVKSCGICGSDVPRVFTKGTYHFPTIIGHEFSGIVAEDSEGKLVGKRVAVFPLLPCFRVSPAKRKIMRLVSIMTITVLVVMGGWQSISP